MGNFTRREVLSILGCLGAVAAPIAAVGLVGSQAVATLYKGYQLHWTGFKPSQSNCLLIGQWVAWGPQLDGLHYYACSTGTISSFRSGDLFDISAALDFEPITLNSTEEAKERVKQQTYKHLLNLLDGVKPL